MGKAPPPRLARRRSRLPVAAPGARAIRASLARTVQRALGRPLRVEPENGCGQFETLRSWFRIANASLRAGVRANYVQVEELIHRIFRSGEGGA